MRTKKSVSSRSNSEEGGGGTKRSKIKYTKIVKLALRLECRGEHPQEVDIFARIVTRFAYVKLNEFHSNRE